MRVQQQEGLKGSLKWIQRLVERFPDALEVSLRSVGALGQSSSLNWLSPLREDCWAEYRDGKFLSLIGHGHLNERLKAFWPRRGPQWDALAVDGGERVYLFEAKAHGSEMTSTCQAGELSLRKIACAVDAAKKTYGVSPDNDWLTGYYQYANRLAWLSFLKAHEVDVRLIFLYFTGDCDMEGPASAAEWQPYINAAHAHLGLEQEPNDVITMFLDVAQLS